MKAYYKGNKVIVVSGNQEYPFCLAVEITKAKAVQLMTKMDANGVGCYEPESGTVNYQEWDSVVLA